MREPALTNQTVTENTYSSEQAHLVKQHHSSPEYLICPCGLFLQRHGKESAIFFMDQNIAFTRRVSFCLGEQRASEGHPSQPAPTMTLLLHTQTSKHN